MLPTPMYLATSSKPKPATINNLAEREEVSGVKHIWGNEKLYKQNCVDYTTESCL